MIEEWHFAGGVEFVVLFYARPVSGAWYRVQGVRLLPVDEEWINGLKVKPWPSKSLPEFTMDESRLFRFLDPRIPVCVAISRICRIAGERKCQPTGVDAGGRAKYRGSSSRSDHRIAAASASHDHVRTAGHHRRL